MPLYGLLTKRRHCGISDILLQQQESSNKKVTSRKQQQESSNKKAATRQQHQDSSIKTAATRQQQQESSNKKAATRQQQQDSSSIGEQAGPGSSCRRIGWQDGLMKRRHQGGRNRRCRLRVMLH
ncbi:hypothetical protein cyc_01188 [Cyclospora cayetanensis]|uniref:Uncharacterized protein n=1 Tax=Cyclospora cayetanensis TaxID=88456 RepID=A0A1D3CUI5_9EIME|nr:hypothetical protein cyc_01188 [Cyclospora cayetanensis]